MGKGPQRSPIRRVSLTARGGTCSRFGARRDKTRHQATRVRADGDLTRRSAAILAM